MAVKATFLADFTSFQTAVSQAELKLRSFESGAAGVEKALARVGDSFSGRRVLQETELAVKAVNDLGGVTTLTKNEQAALNAKVTEAIAKYEALGQEAPEDLKKVSRELAQQKLTFKDLAVAAGAIAGIVAGASAAIGKLGERGAGVNDVKEQFAGLTSEIGETADVMLGKLREATLGNISDFQLMQTANLAMSQGLALSAEQFGLLGDTAAVLADRTGKDVKEAFDVLSQAMATGQDRTLKTIGLNIDAAKAEEAYAASIGKKRSELDEAEKKHAIQNAILAEGQNILALSGKAQEDFADKVGQSSAKISNFVDRIGSWIATSPSIGAWTSTITAASSTITAMGLAFGPVSAGVTKLIPLVSGLGATFATLGATVAATVVPALTAAFALLSPILVPLAAVAAAVTAVYLAWRYWDEIVAFFKGAWKYVTDAVKDVPDWLLALTGPIGGVIVAWRHWDEIVAIVKNVYTATKEWLGNKLGPIWTSIKDGTVSVAKSFIDLHVQALLYAQKIYEGVKSWLLDKFTAIVDGIKQKINAVTDAFKGMYDKVVGNSYVPDMVERIGKEFGSLDKLMTDPVRAATSIVESLFSGMFDKVDGMVDGWIGGLTKKMGGLGGILEGALGGGLGGLISGGLGGLIGAGIGAISDKLRGGEEGITVNPARDQFAGALRDRFGGGNNFEGLVNALAAAGVHGSEAESLIRRLQDADKVSLWESAQNAFIAALERGGISGIERFERGGFVSGSGATPAILHGGEGVLSTRGMAALEQLNRGQGLSRVPITVVLELDGRVLGRATAEYLPGALATMGVRVA